MQVGTSVRTPGDRTYSSVDNLNYNDLKTSSLSAVRTINDNENRSMHDATSLTTNLRSASQPNQYNTSSSLGNLSFINIVGLPYHPRQSSVPSTTTLRNQVGSNVPIFPNHFRNASESSVVPPRPPRATSEIIANGAPVIPPKNRMSIDSSRIASSTLTNNKLTPSTSYPLTNFRNVPLENQHNAQTVPENVQPLNKTCDILSNTNNVSNINVNFYRAVPMSIISSVPTIKCLNTTHSAKNVSNVQIMPLSDSSINQNSGSTPGPCMTSITSTQVTVHNEHPTQVMSPSVSETISSVYLSNRPVVPERTFTSTEAQTDDISLGYPSVVNDKDRRRRARRERRTNRRANPISSRHAGETSTQSTSALPNVLESHLPPPPYTTLSDSFPRNQHVPNVHPIPTRTVQNLGMIPQSVVVPPSQILRGMLPSPLTQNMLPQARPRATLQNIVPNSAPSIGYSTQNVVAGQVPIVQNVPDNSGLRFAVPVGQFRRDHFSEETPKRCCGVLSWKPSSLKWFLASIALVAIGCVLVGTALGTMKPAGRDHITIALLMIGIGIVLVTISGIAWRLASQNATSCRTMLGIGSLESIDVCTRRFVPRMPPTYGRPHHPYAAMMYPEFQYRPPPPTYQASMQEYRLRLLLIDRGNAPQMHNGLPQNVVAPPPTYRSHNGSLLRDPIYGRNEVAWSEYSCPPSYRSQTYSSRLGTIRDSVSIHTRDQSLSSIERTNENTIEVVNIHRSPEENTNIEEITIDTKTDQDAGSYKLILEDCVDGFESNKEGNLVTIVQTDDRSPVILTVSGSSEVGNNSNDNKLPNEIQILAHL